MGESSSSGSSCKLRVNYKVTRASDFDILPSGGERLEVHSVMSCLGPCGQNNTHIHTVREIIQGKMATRVLQSMGNGLNQARKGVRGNQQVSITIR